MSIEELIQYLTGYIKACKIKGDPYIFVYMGILYLIDEDLSSLYVINLDHSIDIVAARYNELVKGHTMNISIYNQIIRVINTYTTLPTNSFDKISRCDTIDYDIPSRVSDLGKITKYYFDNDPVSTVLIPEFYGMVPVNKSDTYEIYYNAINKHSGIVMYVITKKKPKIKITMYRHILNLYLK